MNSPPQPNRVCQPDSFRAYKHKPPHKMSAIEQITTLLDTLSFAEKLSLNERIAIAIRKEGGGKSGGKAVKSKSKSKDSEDAEAKPKRKAAAGTLAWTAFVKHIKTTQPDIFEGVTKESDKLVIVKGIRAEDMDAYNAFVTEWKEKYAVSEASPSEAEPEEAEAEAEAEVEEAAPPPPVKKQKTAAEKLAELKAAAALKPSAAPAPAAPAAKKEVKKAAAAPAAKAVKEVKKAAPAAKAKATEEPQMAQIELDGKTYWHEPVSHGLWEVTGDTFAEGSAWMGYYQPGNEEEPIRYTENFGDE
jgi:hypothetical protein